MPFRFNCDLNLVVFFGVPTVAMEARAEQDKTSGGSGLQRQVLCIPQAYEKLCTTKNEQL